MIYWGLIWAIPPTAVDVSIFIPAFTPRNIEDSQSTEKIEEKIEKSMKYSKCIDDVKSEVNDLLSYSKAIEFSNPSCALVVLDEAKDAFK